MWLQNWKESRGIKEGTDLWALIAKGSQVYLLSNSWLERLWEVLRNAANLEDLQRLLQFPLDNSDIVDETGLLLTGLTIGLHYTVVQKEAVSLLFGPLLPITALKPTGYLAWEGMVTPRVLPDPLILPCVLCHQKNKVAYDLPLEGNIPLSEVKERLLRTPLFTLERDIDMVLLNVRHPYTQSELLAALQRYSDLSEVDWMSPIALEACNILEVLTAGVLCVEYKSRPNWFFSLFSSKSTPKATGLKNLWNNCYLNSILQSLAHIYPFLMHYTGKPSSPHDSPMLVEVRSALSALHRNEIAYSPEELLRLLAEASDSFALGKQADAQECLITVIGHLEVEVPRLEMDLAPVFHEEMWEGEKAWVSYLRAAPVISGELFGGLQKVEFRCIVCNHSNSHYSFFQTVSLYLPASRNLAITFIPLRLKEFSKQFQVQSATPLESNETIRSIWDQIASSLKVHNFVIGKMRDGLFEGPFGMSDLAVLSGYTIMELPVPEKCAIMVDIYEENSPIASRIVALDPNTRLEKVQELVLASLGEAAVQAEVQDKAILSLLKDHESPEKLQKRLISGALLVPTSLDSSQQAYSPLNYSELGGEVLVSISDFCKRCNGKIPRFRLTIKDLPSSLKNCLQKNTPSRSFFFGNLMGASGDEDTTLTLLQMMDFTLNDKPMNETDLVKCGKCERSTQHTTASAFIHLPRVLVFALQRIRVFSTRFNKTEINIQYPISDLDLSEYEKGANCSPAVYDLKAMVSHSGSLSRGHYTATVQDPATSQWFLCDDETVTAVPPIAALDERNAYLLFYCRR